MSQKNRAHLDFFWTTEGCLYYDMEIDSRMDGNGSLGEVWNGVPTSFLMIHDLNMPGM